MLWPSSLVDFRPWIDRGVEVFVVGHRVDDLTGNYCEALAVRYLMKDVLAKRGKVGDLDPVDARSPLQIETRRASPVITSA